MTVGTGQPMGSSARMSTFFIGGDEAKEEWAEALTGFYDRYKRSPWEHGSSCIAAFAFRN